MSANDRQVGGDHYRSTGMQHWDFAAACYGSGYFKGCITKYVSRWRKKGGIADLHKALHFMQKLREIDWHVFGWETTRPSTKMIAVKYILDNALGPHETDIVRAITVGDLELAEKELTALITEAEACEPQPKGYVDQD